jgi:hypothetical protein
MQSKKITVISSQRYLDDEIVQQKIELLRGETAISLPVYDLPEYNCGILFNGHHTLAAAQNLGIRITYYFISHPEGLTENDLLEQCWIDSAYYDTDTGVDFF